MVKRFGKQIYGIYIQNLYCKRVDYKINECGFVTFLHQLIVIRHPKKKKRKQKKKQKRERERDISIRQRRDGTSKMKTENEKTGTK